MKRLLLALVITAGLSIVVSDNYTIAKTVKKPVKPVTVRRVLPCAADFSKYENKMSYYLNVQMSSSSVIPKALWAKKMVMLEINGAELENFNASESSANLQFSIPINAEDQAEKLFESDPELTQFNKSNSRIGSSLRQAADGYYSFKALSDNLDEVLRVVRARVNYKINESKLREMLQNQMDNYKSNMDEYEKQLNRVRLQIYIRQKQEEKER